VIIVTGSIEARPDSFERVLELSLEHVRRSRLEPGCLYHSVHVDAENGQRVVFLERWQDGDALRAHFAVTASNDFVTEAVGLAVAPPEIAIYEAEPVSV
jgi:quinol monooxygenase YgiN